MEGVGDSDMSISRLWDGRLFRIEEGKAEVFDGTSWVPTKGVSGIEVHESIPLD